MEIEINGLTYKQKEQPQQGTRKALPKGLLSLMMMGAMMMEPLNETLPKKEKSTPKVNIIEEYKLIMQKKSKLSKRERDYVIKIFNENYELTL